MKRTATVLASMLAGIVLAQAQIPNAGFETWTNGNPDGWKTTNNQLATVISQSSTAHGGSSAVLGQVKLVSTFPVPPELSAGVNGNGFPYASRPAALTGYYQLTSVSGDEILVSVGFAKAGNGMGAGSLIITSAASSYTQFSVPLIYVTGDNPDTAFIVISMTNSGATVHDGSSFLIDDLSFSATSAVTQPATTAPLTFSLAQNFPNPFNPTTKIRYTVGATRGQESGTSAVRLAVYNVLGQEVAVLADGQQAPGSYEATFDGSKLASGIYFYRLTAGTFSTMKAMVLTK